MPRRRVLITDFSIGMVSKRMAGRLDTAIQQKAAAELTGFVVSPDGGIRRRAGSLAVYDEMGVPVDADGLFGSDPIPGFVVLRKGEADSQSAILLWWQQTPTERIKARDLQSGTEYNLGNSAYQGEPMNATPTVYAEPTADVENQFALVRRGDGVWKIDLFDMTISDWGSDEVADVYQNRLVLIDRRWGNIRTSVPLDMLNFDLTEEVEIPDTDPVEYETVDTGAIEAIPDFYGSEQVRWILARAGLYFGTDRAEYEVTSSAGYLSTDPGGFIIRRISNIGASQAIPYGSSMVLRKQNKLTRVQWSDNEQSYIAASVGSFLDMSDIVHIAVVEHGSHRYLIVLDVSRTLYCLTESAPNNISAFTVLMDDVWWFWEYQGDVFVARRPHDDSQYFWIESIPLDTVDQPGGRTSFDRLLQQQNNIHGDRGEYLKVSASGFTGNKLPDVSTVKVYAFINDHFEFVAKVPTTATGTVNMSIAEIYSYTDPESVQVIGDGRTVGGSFLGAHLIIGEFVFIGGGPIGGLIREVDTVHLWCHEVAGEFVSRVKTLPVNVPDALGVALGEYKHVGGVTVLVHQSGSFRARVNDGPWEKWEVDELYSGPVSLTLESASAPSVQVEIESIDADPLNVMSIEADVFIGGV